MKRIKKILKWFFGIVLLGIIALNIAIVITGRYYIYKGIQSTYFRGTMRPTIYDLDVFTNRTLPVKAPQPWKLHEAFNHLELLEEERTLIESLDPAGFVVAWGDSLIYEEYWNGHSQEKVSNSFSMGKSVIALLIGVALDEGAIQSLDEPVANYLEEFKDEKKNITIRHVLTMTTGLSWSESYVSPFCDVAELYYDTDARDLALNRREIEEEPGKYFRYKSGDTQVLMYILEAATGKKLSDYATEKLWNPMGAENDGYWSLVDGKDSEEKAFCCLYATNRDFLRFGKLVNNYGNWNGEQLVSEAYIKEFMSLAPSLNPDGTPNHRYGFQYWIYTGMDFHVSYFRGMRGQYIISIPEKELVIVRTGSATQPNFENSSTEKNDALVGHYGELDDYINIGLRLLKEAKKFK